MRLPTARSSRAFTQNGCSCSVADRFGYGLAARNLRTFTSSLQFTSGYLNGALQLYAQFARLASGRLFPAQRYAADLELYLTEGAQHS